MQRNKSPASSNLPPRHGVARVISKLGIASRTQATRWVHEGRVTVNGRAVADPDFPVRQGVDRIEIAGLQQGAVERVVVMLNKPRGLLTTTRDEQGRDTVYACFEGAGLPWLAPVGRLDKASEGLLLFSNDPEWAAALAAPGGDHAKTYHVQVDCVPEPSMLSAIAAGVAVDGERLGARSVRMLRRGEKNAWLEIVLEAGRNRQIRRLLKAFDISVLRLVRVAIGPLQLGELAKGKWRALSADEIAALSQAPITPRSRGA
jgi:23S rRNA pseudouridine2605 synthase